MILLTVSILRQERENQIVIGVIVKLKYPGMKKKERINSVKTAYRSSCLEVFLRKGVLKICSKFTGEHPCRSTTSIKLQSNHIEITLWHGCSTVNLLHIFRTPLSKNLDGCFYAYIQHVIITAFSIVIPVNFIQLLTIY